MNLPQKLISEGFNFVKGSLFKNSETNLNNFDKGWFGCTEQNPDVRYLKGDCAVDFSLQGTTAAFHNYLWTEARSKLSDLVVRKQVKFIMFRQGHDVLYSSFNGTLPNEDFIKNFISNAR